jgi:cbb3-type cytochrome oxidase subunit 3
MAAFGMVFVSFSGLIGVIWYMQRDEIKEIKEQADKDRIEFREQAQQDRQENRETSNKIFSKLDDLYKLVYSGKSDA